MTTVVDVLKKTEQYFKSRGIPSPRLDAELIVGHHLGMSRVDLYLNFDKPLKEHELGPMRADVKRRSDREPIAWILGTKGFWNLDLSTHPQVLVPRPDSETLVETALQLIPEEERCFVADVGTGTGAIGLAIAANRPEARVFCTDISEAALRCAKQNAEQLKLTDRVAVLKGALLEPIPVARDIDIVVSNPPYIPSQDIDSLAPEIANHEPRLALDGGPDGLQIYRELIPIAAKRARIGVIVEHGDGQNPAVVSMMQSAGLTHISEHADLTGTVRVVCGKHSE